MSTYPVSSPQASLRPRFVPAALVSLALAVTFMVTLYAAAAGEGLQDVARLLCPLLSGVALLCASLWMPRQFSAGWLCAALLMLINWRVAAMMSLWPVIWASAASALLLLLALFDCMRNDWLHSQASRSLSGLEWQMTVVRIWFGFDMVGHFTEKLFAGGGSYQHMIGIFDHLGVPLPGLFVIVGGLCELGIAIGIGLGLFTRLAALGGTLYFMIANHFGDHFANGFTWSNGPTGGWEYPLLMAVLYLSFVLCGAGRFSLDGWLLQWRAFPAVLKPLCVPRSTDSPTHR